MKKNYFYMLALLFVFVLAGACVNKAVAPAEEEEIVTDEQQVEVEAVDSVATVIQAEAEAVETPTKELK